jgi:lipopolysaccharide transport system permease protein
MQSSFLVTPVMWEVSIVPPYIQKYIYLNPFACIIEILRGAFFNVIPPWYAYCSLTIWVVFVMLLSVVLYKKLSRNLVFWM